MLQHDSENVLPNLRVPDMTTLNSRRNEKLNSGRWKADEHNKFLSAIIDHGNDWKLVQKCIKSRSSTQARSHAQKFLLKLRKKLKIEPDGTNKLSKDAIDKIVKEIVETSAYKNNPFFDKEKLVKLIMGFSNLLVGRIVPAMSGSEYQGSNNNYFYGGNNANTNDPFFDCGSPYQYPANAFFLKPTEDTSRKVFNIEKIYKGNRQASTLTDNFSSLPSGHSLFIEKSNKPLETSQLFNNGELSLPKNSFNISQINNQNDLLKYLLQHQDPNNPNKNVVNIISINICNKNEGDNTNNNTIPVSNLLNAGLLTANTTASNTPHLKKTPQPVTAPTSRINLNFAKGESPIVAPKAHVLSKVHSTAKQSPQNVNNNKSASSSASSDHYERDFYDNSSGSYFNNQNEEDIDKYFVEWN